MDGTNLIRPGHDAAVKVGAHGGLPSIVSNGDLDTGAIAFAIRCRDSFDFSEESILTGHKLRHDGLANRALQNVQGY